jgi:anthranilate synthase/indole-3-glycerol phosphate synthase/phosphoribosylanthranilate isomerase
MADAKESILDRIAKQRRLDSAAAEAQTSCEALQKRSDRLASEIGPPLSLHTRLANNQKQAAADATLPKLSIAAEFKRASPSKGNIALGLNAGEQGLRYANAGASVISVLTEPTWFKGSMDDLLDVRRKVADMPDSQRPLILRKDFVIRFVCDLSRICTCIEFRRARM